MSQLLSINTFLHRHYIFLPSLFPPGSENFGSAANDQEGCAGGASPSPWLPEPVQPGACHEPGRSATLAASPGEYYRHLPCGGKYHMSHCHHFNLFLKLCFQWVVKNTKRHLSKVCCSLDRMMARWLISWVSTHCLLPLWTTLCTAV